MLLSKLVYLVVKNAIYYADPNFFYESFLEHLNDFANDSDYALNINNALSPINEAIARLSDLDKIPHLIQEVSTNEYGYKVDLTRVIKTINSFDIGVKEVVGIGDKNYRKVGHISFGENAVVLERPCAQVYVEFKGDFPPFSIGDIGYLDQSSSVAGTFVDSNVELRNFGITDSMCNYIIEYAQGRLMEPIAPELANMHLTRAETYFANMRDVKSAFTQKNVNVVFSMGQDMGGNSSICIENGIEDLTHENAILRAEIDSLKGN